MIEPMEYNVLVEPEVVEEKTAGGIILPDDVKKLDQTAQTRGRLVAVSPMAFKNSDWPDGARTPQVGDTVAFARYAGVSSRIEESGVEYALMKDNEITAVLERSDD